MPSYRDVVPGQVYGRCTVLQIGLFKHYANGKRARACLVRCACGREFTTSVYNLLQGDTTSCGCAAHERIVAWKQTHGESKGPLYAKWITIRMRCQNPRNAYYALYGGRGITVCDAWNTSFEAFRDWALSHGYAPGLTIERRDVNGHYTPENCCFIPMARQALNKRNTRLLSCWGETKPLTEWLRDPRCVVGRGALETRLTYGWPLERALTYPPDPAHTSASVYVSCWGETKTIAEWSRDPRCVVSYERAHARIRIGWPPEQALTLSTRAWKRHVLPSLSKAKGDEQGPDGIG